MSILLRNKNPTSGVGMICDFLEKRLVNFPHLLFYVWQGTFFRGFLKVQKTVAHFEPTLLTKHDFGRRQ